MIKIKYFALISSLLFSPVAFSSDLVLFGALSGGGAKLAETSDGNELRAGGFVQLSGGLEHKFSETLVLQSMLGWKFDSVTASDGDASFDRFPIDVNIISRMEKFEISLGLSYHINPKYKIQIDGLGSNTVSFDDAVGPSVGLGMLVNENLNMGLRFTNMDYEVGNVSVDGNSLAIYMSTTIGN